MVALTPVSDNTPASYPRKATTDGLEPLETIKPTDQVPVTIRTAEVAPTESACADPSTITANGNASTPRAQKGRNDTVTHATTSDPLSDDQTMTLNILKIIESYGVDYEKNGASWKGFDSFMPMVRERVKRQEPIRMILPAFPFKSPNARDKVLGTMPDFGEELALFHLNGLCENIAQVYTPGADVYISSDGLVYNGK